MPRPPGVNAAADDALGGDDMSGVLERLRAQGVSPSEVLAAARSRVEAVNPQLNAVACSVAPPARPPDAAAALAGIPIAVKDNDDVPGYPTRQGSRAVPDRPAEAATPWVEQAMGLGLMPVAKSTLPEFGLTASTESSLIGATRNPHDPTRSVGGSSGGAAALVASGALPLAHANDGGGSIRIPAACCGLVGLKPTRGRIVDRPDLARLPVPITAQGVLTRTVRDTIAYLEAAEESSGQRAMPSVRPRRMLRPLRIGLITHAPHDVPVHPDVQAAVHMAAAMLEHLGHRVDPIGQPVDERFGRDFLLYWQLLAFALAHAGRAVVGPGFDPALTEPFTRYLARRAVLDAPLIPAAVTRLRRTARAPQAVFDALDVVLSPVLAHPPPPIGALGPDAPPRDHLVALLRWTAFTPWQNVTGSPAIALPIGQTADGLPVGVQLTARRGDDGLLLHLAAQLEPGW